MKINHNFAPQKYLAVSIIDIPLDKFYVLTKNNYPFFPIKALLFLFFIQQKLRNTIKKEIRFSHAATKQMSVK